MSRIVLRKEGAANETRMAAITNTISVSINVKPAANVNPATRLLALLCTGNLFTAYLPVLSDV